MPTAAQQYVIIQEQMQREAKLGKRREDSFTLKGQSSPAPSNPITPAPLSATRFTSLRDNVSFSSYPPESVASPVPSVNSSHIYLTRSNTDPLKAESSSFPKASEKRESFYGISPSVSGISTTTPIPMSPRTRRVSFDKSRQFLTSEQIQSLRVIEDAADKKRSEVEAKENIQWSELAHKMEKAIVKREKEEIKIAEKKKAQIEKEEIKALKKECKAEFKAQRGGEAQSSKRGSIGEGIFQANPSNSRSDMAPTSNSSVTSFHYNAEFTNSSFFDATGNQSNQSFATNASFPTKKKKSFARRVSSILSLTDESSKKKKVVEGPPFTFTAPKYVSKNEEREILIQPMAFAPPPRPTRMTAKENKRPIAKRVAIPKHLANVIEDSKKNPQNESSRTLDGECSPSVKKAKNDSFFSFGSTDKKKKPKIKKNSEKLKDMDDMIVRGSLAAFGNTNGDIIGIPSSFARGSDAIPTHESKEDLAEINKVIVPCNDTEKTALGSEEIPAAKTKLSYYAYRSHVRRQQIYRRNGYKPSKNPQPLAGRSTPAGRTIGDSPHTGGRCTSHLNITNAMYRSYYKAPKYIARPEERAVLGQPTEITGSEKAAAKKRVGQSKWETEDERLARRLYSSVQSLRKETFFSQQEARSKILAEYDSATRELLSKKEGAKVQTDVIVEKKAEGILQDQLMPQVPVQHAVESRNNEKQKKSKNGEKPQKKKKFWHMFSCKKATDVRTEKAEY